MGPIYNRHLYTFIDKRIDLGLSLSIGFTCRVPNKNNHTYNCRDPETAVSNFWSPGGVRDRPLLPPPPLLLLVVVVYN